MAIRPLKSKARRIAEKRITDFLGEYILAPKKVRKEMAFQLLTAGRYVDSKYVLAVDVKTWERFIIFHVAEAVDGYRACLVISRLVLSRIAGTTIREW